MVTQARATARERERRYRLESSLTHEGLATELYMRE